ncbi:hypothetical protein LZ30DRAFT_714089 [Colletotrichum cereale]|nr:hypothetical protein LZ30DRAFT_714089 [Colletotrichum cereale]
MKIVWILIFFFSSRERLGPGPPSRVFPISHGDTPLSGGWPPFFSFFGDSCRRSGARASVGGRGRRMGAFGGPAGEAARWLFISRAGRQARPAGLAEN